MPKEKTFSDQLKEFSKPLSVDEITWKIQGYTKDKSKTIIVPYIDNRAVMSRLDMCFGAENWSNCFREIVGGFICSLTINGTTKEDGADKTKIEPTKGGVSDSMKRVAVQWGMGRDLYDYPKVMITGQVFYIPDDIKKTLDELTKKKNDVGVSVPVVVLNPK